VDPVTIELKLAGPEPSQPSPGAVYFNIILYLDLFRKLSPLQISENGNVFITFVISDHQAVSYIVVINK